MRATPPRPRATHPPGRAPSADRPRRPPTAPPCLPSTPPRPPGLRVGPVRDQRTGVQDGEASTSADSTGVNAVPRGHAVLFERVVESGGLLVSEWADGPAWSGAGAERSADLAARLAAAVVLVEPDSRSGDGQLSRAARQLRRPLFTVPGPMTTDAYEFAHNLIRRRWARLVTGAGDVLADLGRCARAAE